MTDLTFIEDGNPDNINDIEHLINFDKRRRTAAVIAEIKQYQQTPYNFKMMPIIKGNTHYSIFIINNLFINFIFKFYLLSFYFYLCFICINYFIYFIIYYIFLLFILNYEYNVFIYIILFLFFFEIF